MELVNLAIALVIVLAAWVLVAQLLGLSAREHVHSDRQAHGD